MDKIIDLLSEKVINNEWGMYEFRGKDYYGITIGSYQYNDIINDFQVQVYQFTLKKNNLENWNIS